MEIVQAVKGALSRYSVTFLPIFCGRKWRRSHRGRTRSDQSRRRPGKNPSIAIARLGLRERESESKGCDTTFVAKTSRLKSSCFSSSCSAEVPSSFFPRSRLKTMAEIEFDISHFSCSGQLAPVSLAPTTAGEARSMPACVATSDHRRVCIDRPRKVGSCEALWQ